MIGAMNADEFLALTEKFPLPWRLSADEVEGYQLDSDYGQWSKVIKDADPLVGPLADAAPALAAAAIRLLANAPTLAVANRGLGPERCYVVGEEFMEYVAAIRAALPASLRP